MFVQNDLVDKNNWLVELLQKEPFVRSSVSRLVSHLVTSEIQICESTHQTSVSFKKINEKLHYILQKKLRQVIPIAVQQAFYCGFCVFVMQKSDNPALKKFPYLLPVGSYTWTVEHVSENTKKRKRESPAFYRYRVMPHHGDISEEDLYVYEFQAPTVSSEILPSPLDNLLATYKRILNLQEKIDKTVEWNSVKHITTSERVDIPKDNTSDGLSLLDEFRRYIVSGQHSGISRQYAMFNTPGSEYYRENPSVATKKLCDMSFETSAEKYAKMHFLPPNTEVHELGCLNLNFNLDELMSFYERQVYTFFNLQNATNLGSQNIAAFAKDCEISQSKIVTNFCQSLIEYMYAAMFDIPEMNVKVKFPVPTNIYEEMLQKSNKDQSSSGSASSSASSSAAKSDAPNNSKAQNSNTDKKVSLEVSVNTAENKTSKADKKTEQKKS